jgi:dihydrofolate synthase/folylpolyglutamate synthase
VADAKVAVVTNVGKDHTDATGDWRRRIAEEKAGIIKPGGELVLGETDPELLPVWAAEGPAQTWVNETDFGVETDEIALGGHLVDIRTPLGRYEEVFLPVHGAHQTDNAACAIAAVEMLFGRGLNVELVREAFSSLRLPGRFEVLHRGPLLVLDSAHNPDGARTTARTLAEEFDVQGRRRWVLGMLGGRDVDEMVEGFCIRPGDQVVACNPDWPRAMPAKDVARAAQDRGAEVEVIPSPTEALSFAWRTAAVAGEGDLVMVTGSHYTVGEARTQCRRLGLLPPDGAPD